MKFQPSHHSYGATDLVVQEQTVAQPLTKADVAVAAPAVLLGIGLALGMGALTGGLAGWMTGDGVGTGVRIGLVSGVMAGAIDLVGLSIRYAAATKE